MIQNIFNQIRTSYWREWMRRLTIYAKRYSTAAHVDQYEQLQLMDAIYFFVGKIFRGVNHNGKSFGATTQHIWQRFNTGMYSRNYSYLCVFHLSWETSQQDSQNNYFRLSHICSCGKLVVRWQLCATSTRCGSLMQVYTTTSEN